MQYENPYLEICLDGPSSVFKGINQKDKEILAQHHLPVMVKKGSLLFREGEKSRGLLCLISGKLKVYRVGVGGREQILKLMKPPDYLGYGTLFSDKKWPFSSEALEDSTVCHLEKTTLIKVLKKNADLTLKLCKLISEELWSSNDRLMALTQKHVRGRLAESILILRDTYGLEADGKTLKVYLSREDIAHLSNMTTSNAIRTLSNMATEGIIELKGRKISVIDSQALEHISELG